MDEKSGMSNFKFGELIEAIMASEGATIDLEIPSFRIKRSHKKSRLGCANCKARRVKVSRLLERGERRVTYAICSVTRSSQAVIGAASEA